MKHDHDGRIAPATPERLDAAVVVVEVAAQTRLADGANAKTCLLERRQVIVDRVRMKGDVVVRAVGTTERAAPAALGPRRVEVGIDKMSADRQHTGHLARPGGKVR